MEQTMINQLPVLMPVTAPAASLQTERKHKAFIEANTETVTLDKMKRDHIIPVFVRDNEPLISHSEFIDTAASITADVFHGEHILHPEIRVSHPIKGRIPDAKDKPAHLLNDWEKTIYYERMAFIIEVPSISDNIGGNQLSLTIGGVKAYNLDKLYSRSACDQHFKLFIGFKNRVCTNLCVWTDGYMSQVRVRNVGQLQTVIRTLLEGYNQNFHLVHLKQFTEFSITEQQFAHLIGRCRMYNHLPAAFKSDIPPILFGDQQMNTVVKDFYKDDSFCRDQDGNINLWKLYNLFTGSNKTSYIDSFLDRSVNAYSFSDQIRLALENRVNNWYLN